jgi:chromosome segregation ATPase
VAAEVDESQETAQAVAASVPEVPPAVEADLAKLHSANQQARQRFRKLIGTLRELREESHGLDQHVNVLTEQLQSARQSQERLAAELHQVQAVAAERESQYGEELDRAIAELSTSYEKSNVLEQQWQTVREQNEKLQSDLNSLNAKISEFDQVEQGWSQEKQRLVAELLSRESELTQLREELSSIKAFFEASVQELRQSSESQHQQLAATITDREHEIAELHQGLEASVTELHEQNETLRGQLTQLTGECDQYQQQAGGQAANLAALTETNAALQNQLAFAAIEFERQRAEFESRIQSAEQAAAEAQLKFDSADPAVLELEAELDVARSERQKLAEDNHRLNEQIAEAEKKIQLLEIDVRSVNAEWQRAQVAAAKLQDEYLTAAAHAADLDAKLADLATATAVEHASQFDLLSGELVGLKQELTAKETALAELNIQRDQAVAQLNDLRQELVRKEADLAASEQLLAELQTSPNDKNQTEEAFATELKLRDARIEQLAAELRFAQDQLADCAAQGERLNDLYQQAQLELAGLAAAPQVPSVEEEVISLPIADDLPPQSPAWPEEDPRDDDESRIVRALVSATAAAELEEESKKEEFQPASFIDRYSHIFDENDDAPSIQPSRTVTSHQRAEPETVLDGGDDSAALEAYMANMMRRVRGESSSEAITPPLSKPVQEDLTSQFSNPVARMNTLTKRVAAVPAQVENAEPAEGLIDLKELKGTSQKPPLPTSLTAMRELANISARQAIAKHRKRRHFEGALSKLLVSGIAGGTAAYMLLTSDDFTSTYFMAGCGVAIVSCFWGFKLLGILLEMIRDGINDEHLPAELDNDETLLPIDGRAE